MKFARCRGTPLASVRLATARQGPDTRSCLPYNGRSHRGVSAVRECGPGRKPARGSRNICPRYDSQAFEPYRHSVRTPCGRPSIRGSECKAVRVRSSTWVRVAMVSATMTGRGVSSGAFAIAHHRPQGRDALSRYCRVHGGVSSARLTNPSSPTDHSNPAEERRPSISRWTKSASIRRIEVVPQEPSATVLAEIRSMNRPVRWRADFGVRAHETNARIARVPSTRLFERFIGFGP